MTFEDAKKLAQYHSYNKIELYEILKDALEKNPASYWSKPSMIYQLMDNGYYFNQCRKWISYDPGVNDNAIIAEIIVIRILQGFGEYSKVQLPVSNTKVDIIMSEVPTL
jgi:hypothetical protein